MDIGLQFHLPSHAGLPVSQLVELGHRAAGAGISQLWVTDNLGSRNPFAVLGALAARVPVRLGTAVLVQYFRSPLDTAGALAAVSELIPGLELAVGIGRGNIRTSRTVTTPRPLATMRETAQCLRRLLDGEEIKATDYPALVDYFRLAPDATLRLSFRPACPVPLLCGSDGPRGLAIGGTYMDGLLCGSMFEAIRRMGHLRDRLRVFDEAAGAAGRPAPRRRVAEYKVSLARDAAESRAFARRNVGARVLALRWKGFTDDDLRALGIEPRDVRALEEAQAAMRGKASTELSAQLADLVTDAMVDAFFIAGDLGHCRERLAEIRSTAEEYGVDQIVLSGISSDFPDGLGLLIDHVMPTL